MTNLQHHQPIALHTHHMEFNVDKAILRNVILQQAGSLQKAIIELVMNELDARATLVDILISNDLSKVIVSGNGKGFVSFDDIEKHFGNFGFAHDTDEEQAMERSYGRYGLGRGQIFSFGKTHWETNSFSMDVDFKSWDPKANDLPYVVQTYGHVLHEGCKVETSLYKPMSIWERNQLESELKRMLRYTSQVIRLNGAQINIGPDAANWTHKTDKLLFKISTGTGGLSIYNKGVFVCSLRHSFFGVSGDLTSHNQAFDVNMARNDIQQTTCTLWPTIKPFLSPLAVKKRSSALTDDDREHMFRAFFAGEMKYNKIEKSRLFPIISGSYMTLEQLLNHANKRLTLSTSAFSNTGVKLHSMKRAAVVSPALLNTLGFDDLPSFINSIISAIDAELKSTGRPDYELSALKKRMESVVFCDFEDLSKSFKASHDIIESASLSNLELCKLKALDNMSRALARDVLKVGARTFLVGRSETALAWTDGRSYIAIKRDLLESAFSKGLGHLVKVAHAIIHEYVHTGESDRDHDHDKDFFLKFHDLTLFKSELILSVAQKSFLSYLRIREKAGLGVLQSDVHKMFGHFGEQLLKSINGELCVEDEADVAKEEQVA